MSVTGRVLALGLLFSVMLATFYQATPNSGLNWFGESFPVLPFLFCTILLLLGIVFGTAFRQISEAEGNTVDIRSVIGSVFKQKSLWISVSVSPFVFYVVYAAVNASPGDPASYLLAFQNGFFCENVFKRMTFSSSS